METAEFGRAARRLANNRCAPSPWRPRSEDAADVYVPLGGNRKGGGRRYVNLFLTMLIGGL
jgi:hypothetical protein